jgi:hypothetical protein
MNELVALIPNYALVESYMKLTHDEMCAIAKGEPHDHIYEYLLDLVIKMAQYRVTSGGTFFDDYDESVNKLVTSGKW